MTPLQVYITAAGVTVILASIVATAAAGRFGKDVD